MELLENHKQNKFQTFSCGRAKVTFDENGYIVNAKDFSAVMWCTPNQDEELIGKHIIELAKILKKSASYHENYVSFLENVVLKFYETQAKNNIDRKSDFNIITDNLTQEDVNNTQMLIPSGGTTNWMINCRDRGYRTRGYSENIVKEIIISNDARIVISDFTQPNHGNNGEEKFFTSVTFYKQELDNHSIYAPHTYERGYSVYYPYGTRFDEKLLKQLGIALSNLMNKARDLEDNDVNRKQLESIYLHQKKLIELLINGTNDKNSVKKIMYDMCFMFTTDRIREARFKKDWLPYFTGELFDDIKEMQQEEAKKLDEKGSSLVKKRIPPKK